MYSHHNINHILIEFNSLVAPCTSVSVISIANCIHLIGCGLNAVSADSIHCIGCGLNAVSADPIHYIGCGLNAVSANSIHCIGCGLNAVSADSIHQIGCSLNDIYMVYLIQPIIYGNLLVVIISLIAF